MANEYKLPYTASEINEKLGKIDNKVSTVNGVSPDENGNVEIQTGEIITEDEMLKMITELELVEPISTVSGELFIDSDGKLFVL